MGRLEDTTLWGADREIAGDGYGVIESRASRGLILHLSFELHARDLKKLGKGPLDRIGEATGGVRLFPETKF